MSETNQLQHEVAFFCHNCSRSFLSSAPNCVYCQGDFVECIADQITDASFATAAPEADRPASFQDQLLQTIRGHLRRHMEATLRNRQDNVDEDALRRHLDAVLHQLDPTGRPAASGDSSDGYSGEENEQPDTNNADPEIIDPDTVDDQNTRSIRINLGNGSEMVVVVSTDNSDLLQTFNLPGGSPQQSILQPFLSLLGYAGDPRDYVNDPTRFADLLDRLFHAAADHTPQPLAPELIDGLSRTECDAEASCPICMDACGGQVCIKLPCTHLFHEACLVPWLQRTGTCPVCRLKLSQ